MSCAFQTRTPQNHLKSFLLYGFLAFSPEILIQQIYGKAREFALLTSSQMMLLLVDAASLETALWIASVCSLRFLNIKHLHIKRSLYLKILVFLWYLFQNNKWLVIPKFYHLLIKLFLHVYYHIKSPSPLTVTSTILNYQLICLLCIS